MPNPLATVFSTIDSAKRILADRLGNPIADLQRTLGRAAEDSGQLRQDMAAGGTTAQDAAERLASAFMPGGMIVGAADKLGFQAASKAKALLDAGISGKGVFANTGVYASPFDKVLRAVIDDRTAILNPTHFTVNGKIKPNRTLGDILDHPELFKIYPELKNIPVLTMPAKWQGEYNGYMQGGKMYINPNLGHGRDALSVVLHETQHGIQDNLGMSPGGTARQFIKDKDTIDKTKELVDTYIKQTSVNPAANAATLTDLNAYKKTLDNIDTKASKSYRNLPGEKEAQFTQKQFEGTLPPDYYPPDYVNKNASTAITYYDTTPEVVALLQRLGITP